MGAEANKEDSVVKGLMVEEWRMMCTEHKELPSLARTDEITRKASDMILQHPAVANTVGIVGLDGATFTFAPNSRKHLQFL